MRTDRRMLCQSVVIALAVWAAGVAGEMPSRTTATSTWCGLVVEPEDRCSRYVAAAYRYPADLDRRHVERAGWVVDDKGKLDRPFPSPYIDGIAFRFLQDMDIEHIVPRSEAHDSGLCSADPAVWRQFASDPANVTVASEHVNRTLKRDKEPQDWLPDVNREWYLRQWLHVKLLYGLSVDPDERDAIRDVIVDCDE